jgi:hypothetical protein
VIGAFSDQECIQLMEEYFVPVAHEGAIQPVAGYAFQASDAGKIKSEADLIKYGKRIL